MVGAVVGELADAEHLRPEGAANRVEQVGEGSVTGQFRGRSPGGADALQVGEVVFDCGGGFVLVPGMGLVGVEGRARGGYVDDIPRGWW